MGTTHSTKDDTRLSPKLARKGERGLKGRTGKRAMSPSPAPLPSARERIISRRLSSHLSNFYNMMSYFTNCSLCPT